MNQNVTANLDRVWDRLRVLSLTLQQTNLEDGDVKTIGSMIDDILVNDLNSIIETIKTESIETLS